MVLPVYKTQPYLKRCIDSLLCHTLENIEIRIVNDDSPDESEKLIKDCYLKEKQNKSIKYIRHRYNKGLGVAGNTGLQNAQGKYVVFVDSDDWLEENCLQVLFSRGCTGASGFGWRVYFLFQWK